MEYIEALMGQLTRMKWSDYLDIIVVACLVFWILPLLRTTGTSRIARVVVVVLLVFWLSDILDLHTLNFILSQFLTVGLIALVVLFQPELRRMIDHLSNVKLKKLLGPQDERELMIPVIRHTVAACEAMSKSRIGALIVFSRDSLLDEYSKTGTVVDAQVSEQIIRSLFFPNSALHDGATIVRDGRVWASGCVLPLSDSNRLNSDLGTRHRAAVGISEVTDAVVVVVSEETGVISVAVGGMLKRHLAPQTLERLLRAELCHEEEKDKDKEPLLGKLVSKVKGGSKK